MIGGCERAPARFLLAFVLAAPAGAAVAAETAEIAETGVLRIRSQPGVEVLWEGVSLGHTDPEGGLEIRDIPPGDYAVVLRKKGYRDVETQLEIGPGASRLERPLERLREETRGSGPVRAPAMAPPPSRAGPQATPARLVEPLPSRQSDRSDTPAGPLGWSPPKGVYVLGLVLCGVGGVLLVLRALAGRPRRRARTRGLHLEETPSQPQESAPLSAIFAAPDFLGALKRREETLEGFFATRRGGRQRRVSEVVNVTPVDGDTAESDRPTEAE